jgi:hypothetical protein
MAKAMQTQAQRAVVQEQGCGALNMLTLSQKDQNRKAGSNEAVAKAMETHALSVGVYEMDTRL